MSEIKKGFNTVDEYITLFPEEVQSILNELRKVIREEAPDAEEKISYKMPTYYLNGNLVHFAAWKNHIGFYGTPSVGKHFNEELAEYKTSKGTIQFPLDKPLPHDLIRKIVRFRVEEKLEK